MVSRQEAGTELAGRIPGGHQVATSAPPRPSKNLGPSPDPKSQRCAAGSLDLKIGSLSRAVRPECRSGVFLVRNGHRDEARPCPPGAVPGPGPHVALSWLPAGCPFIAPLLPPVN